MTINLADVQRELNEIRLRVAGLERVISNLCDKPMLADHDSVLKQVLAFTREIFPGEPRVHEEEDPEIGGDYYIVVEVNAKGSVNQLADVDDRWHRRLAELAERVPGRYRLSISAE